MPKNQAQLAALTRLFSSTVLREMAKRGRSPLFARLLPETGLLNESLTNEETVGSAIQTAFAALRKSGIRNEYIYRAALTHNVLLGSHSLSTASMLSEFRTGSCKADLVILNGTATAYEIKSERDSLARLSNQLASYKKVFAKVYVIAGDVHIHEVMDSAPEDVGVMSLVRWNRISTVREAVESPDRVCPVTIFESLRIPEARSILSNLHVEVADAPNTQLWGLMRQQFAKLAPADVHQQMVLTLKRTRSLAPLSSFVEQLPDALKPAALTTKLHYMDHRRLLDAVRTKLDQAMTWA